MPLVKSGPLRINSLGRIDLDVSVTDHLMSFGRKNIKIQVLLRLGEFTEKDNIYSSTFTLAV